MGVVTYNIIRIMLTISTHWVLAICWVSPKSLPNNYNILTPYYSETLNSLPKVTYLVSRWGNTAFCWKLQNNSVRRQMNETRWWCERGYGKLPRGDDMWLVLWRMRMRSGMEKMRLWMERQYLCRSKSMEVWQSMVNAGNSKGLSVTEELITLSVIDMFLCL